MTKYQLEKLLNTFNLATTEGKLAYINELASYIDRVRLSGTKPEEPKFVLELPKNSPNKVVLYWSDWREETNTMRLCIDVEHSLCLDVEHSDVEE